MAQGAEGTVGFHSHRNLSFQRLPEESHVCRINDHLKAHILARLLLTFAWNSFSFFFLNRHTMII